ncbi:MAG: glycosyltransferase family 4 protein, partial [Bacteroidetes bacterium]|nr:glycosyltransferase family 4 protein [Bacteroidota bacterium]
MGLVPGDSSSSIVPAMDLLVPGLGGIGYLGVDLQQRCNFSVFGHVAVDAVAVVRSSIFGAPSASRGANPYRGGARGSDHPGAADHAARAVPSRTPKSLGSPPIGCGPRHLVGGRRRDPWSGRGAPPSPGGSPFGRQRMGFPHRAVWLDRAHPLGPELDFIDLAPLQARSGCGPLVVSSVGPVVVFGGLHVPSIAARPPYSSGLQPIGDEQPCYCIFSQTIEPNPLNRSAILDYVGRKAGMDYFSLRLHRELRNLGVENTLYTNFSESSDASVRHVFPWEAGARSRWSSTLGYVTGILRTFQGIRRQKSQHFIFHYFKGGLREALVLELARWHGQRIHLLVHDVERLDQSTPQNWFIDFMGGLLRRRIMSRCCHHAYTFSQAAADELLQHAPNLKGRLTVLRHGHFLDLPLPVPTQAQARQALQIKDGTTTLLFFGQIKASKGLDILLEAMNLVQDPDVHLVIAGSAKDVDPQERIQTLVKPSVQMQI